MVFGGNFHYPLLLCYLQARPVLSLLLSAQELPATIAEDVRSEPSESVILLLWQMGKEIASL